MIGILGGGQLGRMLSLAAFPLGERCCFIDPSADAGAGHMSDLIVAAYDDPAALDRLAEKVDVVTYEFENVPSEVARRLAGSKPVYPPPQALDAAQDRIREKELLSKMGYRVPPFAAADTRDELAAGANEVGYPVVAKTRRGGYDGKGQFTLRSADQVDEAWDSLKGAPLIVEGFVAFDRELSIIGARGIDGTTAFYPLTENEHRGGILRCSIAPAPQAEHLQEEAEKAAAAVMEALDYVGILAIELFESDGELFANEMAPRVHNSGHWTIEGAETSQFESHIRAILGLPLGSTAPRGFSAMVNFIGTLPDPAEVLAVEGAHLHLYGKSARPGRKVGHATVRVDDRSKLDAPVARLKAIAG